MESALLPWSVINRVYIESNMPREDDTDPKKAAAQAEAAALAAEEKQKREDRAAVTRGLTDSTTIKQLSSSGYEAKSRRQK